MLVTYPELFEDDKAVCSQPGVGHIGYSTTPRFYGQQCNIALARQQGIDRAHGRRKCNGLQVDRSRLLLYYPRLNTVVSIALGCRGAEHARNGWCGHGAAAGTATTRTRAAERRVTMQHMQHGSVTQHMVPWGQFRAAQRALGDEQIGSIRRRQHDRSRCN